MRGEMSNLIKEMVGLVLQFLDEEKFRGTMHKLEQESGCFFNMEYFEEKILKGEWEEAEKYISGFTISNDNPNSLKIMFEISKQKYLEALDRHDSAEVVDILVNDLHKFSRYDVELYKDMTQLVTLRNIRENAHLTQYGDTRSARMRMTVELRKLIKSNRLLKHKLVFPTMSSNRLEVLINQSLNWQHLDCKHSVPDPEITTLFIDHICPSPVTGPPALAPVTLPVPAVEIPAPFPLMEGAIVPYRAPGGVPSLKRPRTALETSCRFDPSTSTSTAIRMTKETAHVQSTSERPWLKFNKERSVLAVTTADEGYMVLANAIGQLRLNRSPASDQDVLATPAKPTSSQNGANTKRRNSKKQKLLEEVIDKSRPWQLTDIQDPIKCRLGVMPETDSSCKVVRLLYTSCGTAILALGSNGEQRLWKWFRTRRCRILKASASVAPLLVKGDDGSVMANDISGVNLDEAIPCVALTMNNSYAMSAYGGKIKLFNLPNNLAVTRTYVELPPAPTNIAFNPRDNNIIAIGMLDCTIQIWFNKVSEIRAVLMFHKKRITGLVFSFFLGILVSADADAQICAWTIDKWEKKQSVSLCLASQKAPAGATHLQFNCNQVRLLVFHETQLAVYDASEMKLLQQWLPHGILSAPICHAAYSYESKLVYTLFCDSNIGVFDANTLSLRCRIAPSAYFPQAGLWRTDELHTLVIAGNRKVQNQFAVGLSDGAVIVVEPSDGVWGSSPPSDDESSSSTISNRTRPN